MKTIRKAFRLWSSRAWRFAHRGDMPTLIEYLLLAVIILLMSGAGDWYDNIRMREDAQQHAVSAQQTAARVLSCLNGHTSLGAYREHDGSRWAVECSTFERRVKS